MNHRRHSYHQTLFAKVASPFARLVYLGVAVVMAAALAGCFGPNYNAIANRLREDNMKKDAEIASLTQKVANRDATIKDLQARLAANNPPIPTLPPERLAQLFITARIEIRSQTDSNDSGNGKGLDSFRVFLRTLDDGDQIITASGTLTIEAFELPAAPAQPRRLGVWTFSPQEMKKNWYSGLGLNHFAFTCPWTTPPTIPNVFFTARFLDALTGRTLEARLDKNITLPSK